MGTIWKTPSLMTPLLRTDIHIWQAVLDLPIADIQMFKETLSMDEMKRANRFHFDKDRNRFIVRRGILRAILGRYLNVDPRQVQFCYGKKGKPMLSDTFGKEKICFNVSHSEGLALYAFTQDHEIGVDVERVRDIFGMDQIAERFFSVGENTIFSSLPAGKRKESFYNCWTRKEAFIKAIGEGLSFALNAFNVTLAPGEPAELLDIVGNPEEAAYWSVYTLSLAHDYVGAVAVKKHSCSLAHWKWQNQEVN
jgi:4'-phosphopantetheinyl transferase